MIDITFVVVGIIVLCAVFILLRSVFSLQICALCGAVSLAWITLLILLYMGFEIDPLLIGILMGGSIVGFMYILEQKLPEKYQLFRVPFFLTLVSSVYFILERKIFMDTVSVVSLVWLFTLIIHTKQHTEKIRMLKRKIIECCKNW